MIARELSAAEIEQRREARTVHGVYSETKMLPRSEIGYQRLRKALNKAVGRTTPAERRQMRYLARYEAWIAEAELWLATNAAQGMFVDAKSGQLHPLVDRIEGWTAAASRVVARMPERVVKALGEVGQHDLARQLAQPRGRAS
jgi:hypothetical protein